MDGVLCLGASLEHLATDMYISRQVMIPLLCMAYGLPGIVFRWDTRA